jgi:hypothetical protein
MILREMMSIGFYVIIQAIIIITSIIISLLITRYKFEKYGDKNDTLNSFMWILSIISILSILLIILIMWI